MRASSGTQVERVYFDTSGFNYFSQRLDYRSFLGTRDLQKMRGRELFISPISLWEIMLTPSDETADFLVFSAQHLFSPDMLATPSELVVRYLKSAYPVNKVNYSFFTQLDIGHTWRRMTSDASVTYEYDKDALIAHSAFLRRLSTNLSRIIKYPQFPVSSAEIESTARVVQTVYECLENDGFLPLDSGERYDSVLLYKIAVLFVLVIFIFKLDFDPRVMEQFWTEIGIPATDLVARVMHVFEEYPRLLEHGPIMEMSIMAYHQLSLGVRNRGSLFDSMHMVYAPYVHTIISADDDFRTLRDAEPHYRRKLRHIDEIGLRAVPYTENPDEVAS